MKKIAIVAARFSGPSLTFIRDHVRLIAPGRTILISRRDEVLDAFACPSLTGVMPPPETAETNRFQRLLHRFRKPKTSAASMRLSMEDEARVVHFLQEHGCDILLTEFLTEGVRFMNAAAKANVALYAHAHGFDATTVAQHNQEWAKAYDELFNTAAGFFASSNYLANRVIDLGCPADKVSVSPCGINPDLFAPTTREIGRVLAVGRLVEKKAPHHTLAAFAKASDRNPSAHLDIVGDGPLKRRCEQLIRSLGIADKVTMHGAQPHERVMELMARSSVFAQHSVTAPNGDTEGLGISLLEAMASEVPVVATRHNGFVETVVEGETGFLVEEHDVDTMADAMKTLLLDPTKARTMGVAGRTRVCAKFTHKQTQECLRAGMRLDCS